MMHPAIIIASPALIALVVALLAITAAVILPRHRRKRPAPNPEVRLVFADGTGAKPPTDEEQRREPVIPSPDVSDVPLSEAFDGHQVNGEVKTVIEHGDVNPSAGLFSRVGGFLRFGMQRKNHTSKADEPADPPLFGEPEARRSVRKLASVSRVISRAADAPIEERKSDVPAVVSTINERGTTSVDARGVIHEQPAEADFPVERFAENDRVQDVAYATEAERREAEHRMEVERITAERELHETQQRCAQESKEAKHRRAMEILEARAQARKEAIEVQAAARAAIEAHLATWWVRLDPDLSDPHEADRMRLAGSLESVRAPWAARLIVVAIEQEQSERVRARLLGALARSCRTDARPFEAALQRSQLERYALIESLTPFASEAEWISDLVQRANADKGTTQAQPAEDSAVENAEPNVVPLPLSGGTVVEELQETAVSVAS